MLRTGKELALRKSSLRQLNTHEVAAVAGGVRLIEDDRMQSLACNLTNGDTHGALFGSLVCSVSCGSCICISENSCGQCSQSCRNCPAPAPAPK